MVIFHSYVKLPEGILIPLVRLMFPMGKKPHFQTHKKCRDMMIDMMIGFWAVRVTTVSQNGVKVKW